MFKKKPSVRIHISVKKKNMAEINSQIKTLSPLRSSDRRKTAEKIIADYKLESGAEPSDDPEAKATATAAHTALRNSLLPDNDLSAKFTTTSGPSLKEVSGTVYVGGHVSGEQRVLWFSLDGQLYPTGIHLNRLCISRNTAHLV